MKQSNLNRFQHAAFEYYQSNKKLISFGMANVLFAILHFYNAKTLCCFPSLDTIAKCAGVDRSTVIRNIRKLVKAGIVTKWQEPIESGGVKNYYRVTFIASDFCDKPQWQKTTKSRIQTQAYSNSNTKNTVSVHNTNTNTNGNSKSVKDAKSSTDNSPKDARLTSLPIQKGTDSPSLLPGFRWMRNVKRGEDPFTELFNRTGSSHCQAYFPAENGEPEAYEQVGDPLAPDTIAKIKQNPMQAAFESVGGNPSHVLQLTLRSRLKRLGRKHFTAEVINFVSILMGEKTARHTKTKIMDPARALVSRMDKTFAQLIAQSSIKDGTCDWELLWDVAHGLKPIPRVAA